MSLWFVIESLFGAHNATFSVHSRYLQHSIIVGAVKQNVSKKSLRYQASNLTLFRRLEGLSRDYQFICHLTDGDVIMLLCHHGDELAVLPMATNWDSWNLYWQPEYAVSYDLKVSWTQGMGLYLCDRSEILQLSWQQSCQRACWIAQQYENTAFWSLINLTRHNDKTLHWVHVMSIKGKAR